MAYTEIRCGGDKDLLIRSILADTGGYDVEVTEAHRRAESGKLVPSSRLSTISLEEAERRIKECGKCQSNPSRVCDVFLQVPHIG